MINAESEAQFLWWNFRSFAGFRLHAMRAWLKHGHVVRARAIRTYLATHQIRKLHLGATYEVDGFLNSQVTGNIPIDVTRPLPLPDNSFDLIYSSHLVEHLHRKQFHAFLTEALRVLRPGGVNIVATPCLSRIIDASYGSDDEKRRLLFERGRPFYGDDMHTPCHQVNLTMRAFGHRFLYDATYMKAIGLQIGYRSVEVVPNGELPDDALSAYIKKRKPPRWYVETETYVFRKA